jgi:hypothetical protein
MNLRWAAEKKAGRKRFQRTCSSSENGHCAVVRFTGAVCFLPDVHTLVVVVVQQMIATVFKVMDSIQFKVAEWAHPGLI